LPKSLPFYAQTQLRSHPLANAGDEGVSKAAKTVFRPGSEKAENSPGVMIAGVLAKNSEKGFVVAIARQLDLDRPFG
jgi:hypothetical protein